MARYLRYVKIERIDRQPGGRPVYNLAVADDESYVVDGVIVHNCRSVLVPVTLDMTLDEGEFITPSELGRAEELAQEGFK